jgi:hypothetical protein
METPKKPGRPAKLGIAMSDKQRAAMYRNRLYQSTLVAHEDLKGATTTVLLAALGRQLKLIGDASHSGIARDIAAQIIKELCDRHEIRLTHGYEID